MFRLEYRYAGGWKHDQDTYNTRKEAVQEGIYGYWRVEDPEARIVQNGNTWEIYQDNEKTDTYRIVKV